MTCKKGEAPATSANVTSAPKKLVPDNFSIAGGESKALCGNSFGAKRHMTDTQHKVLKILRDSSTYKAMALRGEPCKAFPGLSIGSADADIDTAVDAALEESKRLVPHAKDDEAVQATVKMIFKRYAQAYIDGLREAQDCSQTVGVAASPLDILQSTAKNTRGFR